MNQKYYTDIIPTEILATITNYVVLNNTDQGIEKYLDFLGPISDSKEFNTIWKILAGENYYDPRSSTPKKHPLVRNLFNEFIRLNRIYLGVFGKNIDNIKLRETYNIRNFANYVIFYDTDFYGEHIYVKISVDTFDIYAKTGKVSRGNLFDHPWHGFDAIDSFGVIVNKSKHEKRLRDLESAKMIG
jgi:hypothetical protein